MRIMLIDIGLYKNNSNSLIMNQMRCVWCSLQFKQKVKVNKPLLRIRRDMPTHSNFV